MKKKWILTTLVFVLMIFTYSGFAISADTSLITLDIELDKDIYCIGDTARASVNISQISDSMIGENIGGFQIHLAFDTDVLKYKSGEIKLEDASSLGVHGYNPGDSGAVGNIIALYADDYTLTTPEENGTLILTVEFEVIGSAATESSLVCFSDEQISPDYSGYSCIMVSDEFEEIQCSFDNEAASALTGEYVMYTPVAQYDSNANVISASVDVVLPSDCSGVLVASLYNVANENAPVFLAAKTAPVSGTIPKTIEFENVSGYENLKVKYYLFKGFSTISPLTFPTEAIVVSAGE